ncbi:hypothetical protein BK706_10340 [Bacillus thuringiensis serovar leesis]|nr:hypothetical protein BK706_10400 [Bacillus thuringiensis serovar leesis]OUA92401.1 hypothetical protein BK706_10340 [Bacillus thuringiensis serovar leesis]
MILIPNYANMALLYLSLLQYGAKFYNDWLRDRNKTPNPANSSSNDFKKKLQTKIREYINYCNKKYNEGLNTHKLKNGIYLNLYNRYRREMTLTVLDVIATFSYFDLEIYSMEFKGELTREIYTDAEISPRTELNLEQHEIQFTRQPHLFTYLTGLILNKGLHNEIEDIILLSVINEYNVNNISKIYVPNDRLNNRGSYYPLDLNKGSTTINKINYHIYEENDFPDIYISDGF